MVSNRTSFHDDCPLKFLSNWMPKNEKWKKNKSNIIDDKIVHIITIINQRVFILKYNIFLKFNNTEYLLKQLDIVGNNSYIIYYIFIY